MSGGAGTVPPGLRPAVGPRCRDTGDRPGDEFA